MPVVSRLRFPSCHGSLPRSTAPMPVVSLAHCQGPAARFPSCHGSLPRSTAPMPVVSLAHCQGPAARFPSCHGSLPRSTAPMPVVSLAHCQGPAAGFPSSHAEKIAGPALGQSGFFNFYGKMNSFLRIWVPQFRSSLSTKVQIRISGRSVSRPKGKRSWFTTEGVLLCFQSRIALLSG
jgi:hypothetical protein